MDRTVENTRRYADECLRLGEELGIPCVDAFELIMSAAKKEAKDKGQDEEKVLSGYFWDGLHLSEKGYKVVVDGESYSLGLFTTSA